MFKQEYCFSLFTLTSVICILSGTFTLDSLRLLRKVTKRAAFHAPLCNTVKKKRTNYVECRM